MNLAELFRHETDLQELPAGQTLFREGEPGDLMYVLMSGSAEIFVNNKLVEEAGTGAILGEMALIGDKARSATVVAKSDCRLLPIDHKRFDFLVQQTPHFALHVMRVIAARLREADSML
jgi:CRP/FNR family transcriptional regulator, cyclic AMP receptor protein